MTSSSAPAVEPLRRQSSVDALVDALELRGLREGELAAVKAALESLGFVTTDTFTDQDAIAELTTANLKGALATAGVSKIRLGGLALQVRTKITMWRVSEADVEGSELDGSTTGGLILTGSVLAVALSLMATPSSQAGYTITAGWLLLIAWLAYKPRASFTLIYWCSPLCVIHGIWHRRHNIAAWAWFLMKQWLFWCSGFWVFFYGAKLLQWKAVEATKWDTTTTRTSDGRTTTTMRHRETGQTFTTEEVDEPKHTPYAAPSAGKRQQGTLTIDSWTHCQIGRHEPHRRGEFHSRTRVGGWEYKLVAHVDTGNSADTVMSAKMFDMLFPLKSGSRTDRPGLAYLGTSTIVGATGHSQVLQKYGGLRVMFGGVRSSRGKPLVFTMDVTRRHDDSTWVPGAHQYWDLLVSNQDMKRLVDSHGHTVRVVQYETLAAKG